MSAKLNLNDILSDGIMNAETRMRNAILKMLDDETFEEGKKELKEAGLDYVALNKLAVVRLVDLRKENKSLKTKISCTETTEEERFEAMWRSIAIDYCIRDLLNLITK